MHYALRILDFGARIVVRKSCKKESPDVARQLEKYIYILKTKIAGILKVFRYAESGNIRQNVMDAKYSFNQTTQRLNLNIFFYFI